MVEGAANELQRDGIVLHSKTSRRLQTVSLQHCFKSTKTSRTETREFLLQSCVQDENIRRV